MITISKKLLIIIALNIFLAGVNALGIYVQSVYLNEDAYVLKQLAYLRGMSQRVSKLALAGRAVDAKSLRMEEVFDRLSLKLEGYRQDAAQLRYGIEVMRNDWEEIKTCIVNLDTPISTQSCDKVVAASENFWRNSNELISDQLLAVQSNMRYNILLMVLALLDIALLVLIVHMIRTIVRDKLEQAANYDPLTGSFNRAVYDAFLTKFMEQSRRYGRELTLIVLDIDHFKKVNDTFGHKTGDSVLCEFAETVKGVLRKSDVFCRVGGEEFCVICPDSGLEAAQALAFKIRESVNEHEFAQVGRITVSQGAAVLARDDTPETLYKKADKCLYAAKAGGRDCVYVSESSGAILKACA